MTADPEAIPNASKIYRGEASDVVRTLGAPGHKPRTLHLPSTAFKVIKVL